MADQRTFWFANHEGGGFAQSKTVEAGTTLKQFLTRELSRGLDSYVIRVNGQGGMQEDYILQASDRVTATPSKVAGA